MWARLLVAPADLTPSATEAVLDLPETLVTANGGCRDQTDAIPCGNRVVAW